MMSKYSTDSGKRPQPKTVFGGQEAAPCPKKESASGYRSVPTGPKPLQCIGPKKNLKIFSPKRLTTQGRVNTLIKRQKRSGSHKPPTKGKKLNLEKRIV